MASLVATARNWVDNFHVNAGSRTEREGRTVWVKQRGRMAWLIMRLANGFFRLAGNPIEALTAKPAWSQWEVKCFHMLHGPDFLAGCDADGRPWAELLPGVALSSQLAAHTLTPAMLAAAAIELRRAHQIESAHYTGGWSHGDPHTGNFLYDAQTGRARLIDFEVRHRRHLRPEERHADDLLVLLQDVCGRCHADAWPPLAQAVVQVYRRPEVLATLATKLRVPHGFPRLWWAVRTTWMKSPELERRLNELRKLLCAMERGLPVRMGGIAGFTQTPKDISP